MKKAVKSLISIAVVFSLFLSMSSNIFAQNISVPTNNTDIDQLRSGLVIDKVSSISGMNITEYSFSEDIIESVSNSKVIHSITQINDILYIDYTASNGEHIISQYAGTDLIATSIYNPETDVLYEQTANKETTIENFLGDSHHEMTGAQYEAVCSALESDNIEQLYEIEGIEVARTDSGVVVSPANSEVASRATTKSNYVNANTQFVPYTMRKITSQSMYMSGLKKNATVAVYETRNSYVEKTKDWRTFAAGTTLATIGLFVGGVTLATAVITGLGVAVSLNSEIRDAVNITKSAATTYMGAREGYVYDTTTYNQFVHVYFNSAKGEMHGGLDSKGKFTWIDYLPSNAYNTPASTIVTKTQSLYNADIVTHGHCSLYSPD